MSNGYLVASPADAAAAREIGDGFGLDVIEVDTIGDVETISATLANAANVGLLLSNAAAADANFAALMQALGARLPRAQLIVVEADAREKFAFLPTMWPVMSFDDARTRAAALIAHRPPREEPAPAEQVQSNTEIDSPVAGEEQPETDVVPEDEVSLADARRISIFVSHASTDKSEAERLAHYLHDDGFDTLMPNKALLGEDLRTDVKRLIDTADYVLVLWSAASAHSEWVTIDATIAHDQGKLIPVTLDGTQPQGPLSQLQSLSLQGWQQQEDHPVFIGFATDLKRTLLTRSADAEAAPDNERAITLDPIPEPEFERAPEPESATPEREESFGGEAPAMIEDAIPAPSTEEPPPPPAQAEPTPAPAPAAPPQVAPPEAPHVEAPPPHAPDLETARPPTRPKRSAPGSAPPLGTSAPTAPADATAFAPKKLRRGTPELVRIVVHHPKDLSAVIKAAKKIDPRTDSAPQGMPIGDVAIGASIGVSLEVRGGACDGAIQRRTWTGEPIDFSFSVDADDSVKQAVFLARVFIKDAQIGVLAFTRNVSGPAKKPHSDGDRVRLKRHKRVFLSYSSKDRETVAAIATAYASAGVEHFWDRASLKSGEEWHPRLRREIDRADLFHVCWSRNAAQSEWVKKETEHAITRRRRNSGKPDITVQMLDGPPWAQHPPELDSINFDDFVRAAIVGYARGDGET